MDKKMIVLDLDGTILNTHTSIHPYTKKCVIKLKELGHTIILATGRPWRATETFYDELGLNTPVCNYNGAWIHHPLDPTFPKRMIRIARSFIFNLESTLIDSIENLMCEIEDEVYLHKEDAVIGGFFWQEKAHVQKGSMHDLLLEDPCTVVVQLKTLEAKNHLIMFMQHYPNLVYRFWGGQYDQFVEIFSPNVDKANGIHYINEFMQMDLENLLVIGDANNDLGMLQMGGHSVAMINGTEQAKLVAREITTHPNTEGGVGIYLNKHFRLNIPYEK